MAEAIADAQPHEYERRSNSPSVRVRRRQETKGGFREQQEISSVTMWHHRGWSAIDLHVKVVCPESDGVAIL